MKERMKIAHDVGLSLKPLLVVLILIAGYYLYPLFAVAQNLVFKKIYFMSVFIRFAIVPFLCFSLILGIRKMDLRFNLITGVFVLLIAFSILSLLIRFYLPLRVVNLSICNFPLMITEGSAVRRVDSLWVYMLFSYNVQMFWLITLFCLYVSMKAGRDSFMRILDSIMIFIIILFLINFIFASFQHFTSSSIISGVSGDGYYKAYFGHMGSKFRAFGFMYSGLDFGLLSSMVLFISIYQLLNEGKFRLLWILLIAMAVFGVYITYTRVPYLITFLGIIFLIIIKLRDERIIKIIPFLYFAFGFIVAVIPGVLLKLFGIFLDVKKYIAFDIQAMQIRHEHWQNIISRLGKGGPVDFLFGTGLCQNNRFAYINRYITTDNLYLSITLYNGVFVLICFIILYGVIYYKGVNKLIRQWEAGHYVHPVLIMGFCLMAVLSGISLFNNFIQDIYIYMLIPVLYLTVNNVE